MKPLSFDEAIEYARKRKVIPPKKYYSDLNKEYRHLTFSIAGIDNLNTLSDALKSLSNAIEQGKTFEDWKENIANTLNLNENRLYTIYHTNTQGAFNNGIYKRQEENVEVTPYYMYSAINDSQTRPTHLACNGYIAKYDDDFWKTHSPLCGYNCRCRRIALSETQANKRGLGKQTKPTAKVDEGFDYDKTLGLKKGVALSQKNAKQNILDAEKSLNKSIKKSVLYAIFEKWLKNLVAKDK